MATERPIVTGEQGMNSEGRLETLNWVVPFDKKRMWVYPLDGLS